MRKINLSIIVVNYRSRAYLEKCLASIFAKIGFGVSLEVIVVNNDAESEMRGLAALFPGIKIIQNSENNGFGGANNLGAKEALGEILLFLNPDTEIIYHNVEDVMAEFENDSALGILGSGLMTSDGKIQKWTSGSKVSLWSVLRNNLKNSNNDKLWQNQKRLEVFWVAGTAMFISKALFLELHGFDVNFFMYFEDVDICNRTHLFGKKVVYFPKFLVLHHGGKSFLARKEQKKKYYQSQDYYFQKHFGWFQLGLLKFLRFFSL